MLGVFWWLSYINWLAVCLCLAQLFVHCQFHKLFFFYLEDMNLLVRNITKEAKTLVHAEM